MMETIDLFNKREALEKQLETSVMSLRKTGTAYAQAEMEYKIHLRQEVLKLRDEGTAVTLIPLLCYGIPSVAEKRFLRDSALTIYEANKEAINSIKLRIRIVQSDIERVYQNTGVGNI